MAILQKQTPSHTIQKSTETPSALSFLGKCTQIQLALIKTIVRNKDSLVCSVGFHYRVVTRPPSLPYQPSSLLLQFLRKCTKTLNTFCLFVIVCLSCCLCSCIAFLILPFSVIPVYHTLFNFYHFCFHPDFHQVALLPVTRVASG